MNPKWLKLAADMLNVCSSCLADNGCNDWDFPAGWTVAEKRTFVKAMHAANGSPADYDPKRIDVPDFWVAGFLASQLKAMAELEAKEKT